MYTDADFRVVGRGIPNGSAEILDVFSGYGDYAPNLGPHHTEIPDHIPYYLCPDRDE